LAGDPYVLLSSTPGGNLAGLRGETTKPRESLQLLPTFCNRREPEYLVTIEYSSPLKASAQDFTLKRRGRGEGKSVLVTQSQQNCLLLQTAKTIFCNVNPAIFL